jgi:hypothetical protein
MPMIFMNATNVTFNIDGEVWVSSDYKSWPLTSKNKYQNVFTFEDITGLTIQGKGVVEGQGFMWWVREALNKNIHKRPLLV